MSLTRRQIILDWWASTSSISEETVPFVPTSITGLKLWLKSDAGTFTDSAMTTAATADADPVGGWQDQSANGKNFIQATSTKRGTLKTGANGQNSKSVVRGDGVDDVLACASAVSVATDNYTLFIASRTRIPGSGNAAQVNIGGINDGYGYTINNGPMRDVLMSGVAFLTDSIYVSNTFEIATYQRAAGTSTLRANAVVKSLTLSTSTPLAPTVASLFGIGAAVFADCDIGEVLVYEAALTAGQIASLEAYLNARWAAF